MCPTVGPALGKDGPLRHLAAFIEGDSPRRRACTRSGAARLTSLPLPAANSSCLIAPILQIRSRLVSLALFATLGCSPASTPRRFLPSINSCSPIHSVSHTVSPSGMRALGLDLQELFMGHFGASRQSVLLFGLINGAHPLSVCASSAGLEEISPSSEMPIT